MPMSTIESVEELYPLFERVFPRPTSFDNEYCCVSEEDERPLLTLPLRELTEGMLAMPIDHACGCFGTFEEVSYFVPRLIEILADSEYGFERGVLSYSFYRLLRDNEEQYQSLGVWNAIEKAIRGIFSYRTSTFNIKHYDREACEEKGWGITYYDLVIGTDLMDELLGEFLFPVLSRREDSHSSGCSEWDRFFIRWAEDQNPNRVAHILDIIRRYCTDELLHDYTLPNSFLGSLKQRNYASALTKRAEPAFASIESPTWLRDVLHCLETLAGITIRRFQVSDTREIMTLFYETVHEVNIRDYSQAQVDAWAPKEMDYDSWQKGLSSKLTFVAELGSAIVGFAELEENGHIDRFYCHKEYQGVGIGTRLLSAIEEEACRHGIARLFTEASITAMPFFVKRGFVVLEEQTVTTRGVSFINYRMEKDLS